jgi:hypothetical protein
MRFVAGRGRGANQGLTDEKLNAIGDRLEHIPRSEFQVLTAASMKMALFWVLAS